MIRATQVRAQHRWTQAPADTVVLDFDDRHRRRMAMRGTRGLEFLLDLENAIVLRGGDALVLDDNRLVEVVAAPDLPTQVTAKGLRIRRDHVIEAMVKGLGARVIEIEAPFDPEGGAYAGGGHVHTPETDPHHRAAHGHSSHDHGDHGHHHDHDHRHDHNHLDEHCDHDHHHCHSHAHDRK
jgi:urease accessory protein